MTKSLVFVICLCPTISLLAQTTGTQTVSMMMASPAGTKVIRILKAINQDAEVDDHFVETNFAKELVDKKGSDFLINILKSEIPKSDGKMTVFQIDRPETFKYVVTARASISGWVDMTFTISGSEPYGVKGIDITIVDEPISVRDPIDF